MRIATYNVNGRLPRLLEWLAETSAIENAGYGAIWHGQRSHHGVALLAKGETPTEFELIGDSWLRDGPMQHGIFIPRSGFTRTGST